MRLVNVVISAICAILIVGCSALSSEKILSSENKAVVLSASAQMDETATLRNARICDPTGCYFAWNVVDSDGDGVSDADELMAGTDPYDALSRPSLVVVAELGGKHQLPSFEAGLGAFTIFPAELLAMVEESKNAPLSAFPLTGERADTLTRLGISAELLKQHNIDLTRDGFTVGPLFRKATDSSVPDVVLEPQIGGVELRLISDDMPGGDPNKDDYLVPLVVSDNKLPGGDRERIMVDGSKIINFHDGGGRIEKNGKVIKDWYVNPDADPVSDVPTPEQEAAFFRVQGAAILTVENWYAPNSGVEPSNDDPRATIILVDPEYAYETAIVFDVPTVKGAQPEVRDDLPNPGAPAGDPRPEDAPVDPGVTSP